MYVKKTRQRERPKMGKYEKQRKLEGKSLLTMKRLTLPPEFLTKSFVARTVEETQKESKEDLCNFLQPNLRRSKRISQKISIPISNEVVIESKSIFKEINERYSNIGCTDPVPSSEKTSSFCGELKRQIGVTFKSNPRRDCIKDIHEEKNKVNLIIGGEIDRESKLDQHQKQSKDSESRANYVPLPRCHWVFHTPPQQRLGPPKLEESQLKPGVLSGRDLYALKPNVNVETCLPWRLNIQEVPVNKEYMTKVANISNHYNQDRSWDNLEDSYLSNPKVSRPAENVKRPSTSSHYEQYIVEDRESLGNFEKDFTFIEDGDNFKLSLKTNSNEDYFRSRERFLIGGSGNKPNHFEKLFDFGNMLQ